MKRKTTLTLIQEENSKEVIVPQLHNELLLLIIGFTSNIDFSNLLKFIRISKTFFDMIKPRIDMIFLALLYIIDNCYVITGKYPYFGNYYDSEYSSKESLIEKLETVIKYFNFYFNIDELYRLLLFINYYNDKCNRYFCTENDFITHNEHCNFKLNLEYCLYGKSIEKYKHYSNILIILVLFELEINHIYSKDMINERKFYINYLNNNHPKKTNQIKNIYYYSDSKDKYICLQKLNKAKIINIKDIDNLSSKFKKYIKKKYLPHEKKRKIYNDLLKKINLRSNIAKICNLLYQKKKLKLKNKKLSNNTKFQFIMIKKKGRYLNIFSTELASFRRNCYFLYKDADISFNLLNNRNENYQKNRKIIRDIRDDYFDDNDDVDCYFSWSKLPHMKPNIHDKLKETEKKVISFVL